MQKQLARYFPFLHIKNIRLYYLLGIFMNGWFVLPNWVFFYSRYLSKVDIGIVEGVAVLVGILMEVPTGAVSDLIGKKKTLIMGALFMLTSCLILISARVFWQFLFGQVLMFIGFAFNSGSLEAFAYDSLAEKNLAQNYDKVIAKYIFVAVITTVLATLVGGFLYRIQPELPFVAWIGFLLTEIGILFFTSEPKVDTIKFNFRNYIAQLSSGVKTLFNVHLLHYIVPIIFISCLIKLYQGVVRQSIGQDFGFTGETFGYLLGLIMIPAAFISYKFARIREILGDKKVLLAVLILYGIAFTLPLIGRNILWGGVIFVCMMIAEKMGEPLISVLVNKHTQSKYRATTLSTLALFSQIPYIILVLFFAKFTDLPQIHYLYLTYATLIGLTFFYSFITVPKNNH